MGNKQAHYHAIAGLHGYLPNYSEPCESYDQAVDSLAFLHELGRDRTRRLRRDGTLELDLRRDGNEDAEVSEPCFDTECAPTED